MSIGPTLETTVKPERCCICHKEIQAGTVAMPVLKPEYIIWYHITCYEEIPAGVRHLAEPPVKYEFHPASTQPTPEVYYNWETYQNRKLSEGPFIVKISEPRYSFNGIWIGYMHIDDNDPIFVCIPRKEALEWLLTHI